MSDANSGGWKGTKWTRELKVNVVRRGIELGSISKASKEHGLPPGYGAQWQRLCGSYGWLTDAELAMIGLQEFIRGDGSAVRDKEGDWVVREMPPKAIPAREALLANGLTLESVQASDPKVMRDGAIEAREKAIERATRKDRQSGAMDVWLESTERSYVPGDPNDVDPEGDRPWDRIVLLSVEEPMVWFERFEAFRRMGAGRTIVGACREWHAHQDLAVGPKATNGWYQQSKAWRWRERAEFWDLARVRWRRQCDEEMRLLQRQRRAFVIDRATSVLIEALADDVLRAKMMKGASLAEVIALMKLVLEQSRKEHEGVGMAVTVAADDTDGLGEVDGPVNTTPDHLARVLNVLDDVGIMVRLADDDDTPEDKKSTG